MADPPPLRFTPTAEHLVGEALNVPRQVGHVHLAVAVGVERFQERPKRRGVDAPGASARHAEKHGEPGLCRKRFGAVIMISTVDSVRRGLDERADRSSQV